MARAMNILRYDAVTLGNHEFNYGLPLLATWIDQLGFPALAANAVNARTGKPAVRRRIRGPRFSIRGGNRVRLCSSIRCETRWGRR